MRQLLDVRRRRRTRLAGVRDRGCWPLANRLLRDFLRFRFVAVHRCSPTCAVPFGLPKKPRGFALLGKRGRAGAPFRVTAKPRRPRQCSAARLSQPRSASLTNVIRIWVAVAAIAVPTGVATTITPAIGREVGALIPNA